MNVVFAIKSLAAEGGGAERVLAAVASGLAARGHRVTVLTFDSPDAQSYYPLHPAIDITTISIGDSRASARFYETARRMFAMRQCVRGIAPDVVVGFMHSMFIPLGLALAGTGIPLVASEHIVPEHYKTRPLEKLLLSLTPWLARRITVVSEQARTEYSAALRSCMTVVPNPVSLDFQGSADIVGAANGRKKLLTVGRLEAQKDHATLIEAFAAVAADVPDWDLRIVGEGVLRPMLEAKAASLGIQHRVQLPGTIKEISSEYAGAQLFAVPSLYESFGLVTAEALAHGLPVIGFRECTGTNMLVRSGKNGLLVDGGSDRVGALARSLRTLMLHPEARLRLKPDRAFLTEFAVENVVARWAELLSAVARSQPSTFQGGSKSAGSALPSGPSPKSSRPDVAARQIVA